MTTPTASNAPAPASHITPIPPAVGADASVLANGGNSAIGAEEVDVDGAAEAGLADAAAGVKEAAGIAVMGGAVVGRGVLWTGVELPTVMSELPLL